ncbi:MAG: methyltransferase domain-containing protein [Crocinitomicaceae bacterium]
MEGFKNVDIYLIDQLLKNRIQSNMRILDAGCGSGRHFKFFLENGFDITAIDSDSDVIFRLQNHYPNYYSQKIKYSAVEDFQDVLKYDFIVCNAVLHFAQDHHHFDTMFTNLIDLLNPNGFYLFA